MAKKKNKKIRKNIKTKAYKNSIYIKIDNSKKVGRKLNNNNNNNKTPPNSIPQFQIPQLSRPPIVEIQNNRHKTPILAKEEIENMILNALKKPNHMQTQTEQMVDEPYEVYGLDVPIATESQTPIFTKAEPISGDIQEEDEFYNAYRKEFLDNYPSRREKLLPITRFKDPKNFDILRQQIIYGTYDVNNPTIRKNTKK